MRMPIPDDFAGESGLRGEPPNPYKVYLAKLSKSSEPSIRGCLDRMARLLSGERLSDPPPTPTKGRGADVDWWNLTVAESEALRAAIDAQDWSPAYANKHLVALRQVIHHGWRLGLIDADTKARVSDVERFEGTRLPKGREIIADERDALLSVCDDGTPKGARDAAMIAILYVTGMRRFEIARLRVDDWSASARTMRVIGKRNKERQLSVGTDAVPWLRQWMSHRQWAPGALFCPVLSNGKIVIRHLSPQTVWDVLELRCKAACIDPARPHDFRRTVIGDLLTAGADLVTVQKLAGHTSPDTTSRYDRRGDQIMLDAVDRLHLRQPGGTVDDQP